MYHRNFTVRYTCFMLIQYKKNKTSHTAIKNPKTLLKLEME